MRNPHSAQRQPITSKIIRKPTAGIFEKEFLFFFLNREFRLLFVPTNGTRYRGVPMIHIILISWDKFHKPLQVVVFIKGNTIFTHTHTALPRTYLYIVVESTRKNVLKFNGKYRENVFFFFRNFFFHSTSRPRPHNYYRYQWHYIYYIYIYTILLIYISNDPVLSVICKISVEWPRDIKKKKCFHSNVVNLT